MQVSWIQQLEIEFHTNYIFVWNIFLCVAHLSMSLKHPIIKAFYNIKQFQTNRFQQGEKKKWREMKAEFRWDRNKGFVYGCRKRDKKSYSKNEFNYFIIRPVIFFIFIFLNPKKKLISESFQPTRSAHVFAMYNFYRNHETHTSDSFSAKKIWLQSLRMFLIFFPFLHRKEKKKL